eukprot:scaffold154539_cov24-Tisochrysis_lutea.AAC.6
MAKATAIHSARYSLCRPEARSSPSAWAARSTCCGVSGEAPAAALGCVSSIRPLSSPTSPGPIATSAAIRLTSMERQYVSASTSRCNARRRHSLAGGSRTRFNEGSVAGSEPRARATFWWSTAMAPEIRWAFCRAPHESERLKLINCVVLDTVRLASRTVGERVARAHAR